MLSNNGLTSHIISTLAFLLAAAMLMTVFVMDIFWQQSLVRSFAQHAVNTVSLLVQTEGEKQNLSFLNNVMKSQQLFLQHTGATAGVLLVLKGGTIKKQRFGQEETPWQLEQVAQQSLASGRSVRTLLNFTWNLLVPARKYLIVAQPFSVNSLEKGSVALLYPLAPVYHLMDKQQQVVFGYLLVNFIVLFVIGMFRFHHLAVKPIEQLVHMTDAYEEDGVIPFLSLDKGNALSQLSSALNRMLQRIENDKIKLQLNVNELEKINKEMVATRKEMIRTEKLASIGRLAAGLAHEIGNPLGVIQGYLGLLHQEGLSGVERKDFVDRSEDELQRINKLVRQLLDFSRVNSGHQQDVSLHVILDDLAEMMHCQPIMDEIQISSRLTAKHCVINADPDQMKQVFLNCLLNAADALSHTAKLRKIITISTRIVPVQVELCSSNKEVIEVSIIDNGVGIDEENIENIFDPFFTTKEPGKGTGLGLSVANSIVERYGGSMRVKSKQGEGTTIFVEFPLVYAGKENVNGDFIDG